MKKSLICLIPSLILISTLFVLAANHGLIHQANFIKLKVGNTETTLQSAFDNGYLLDSDSNTKTEVDSFLNLGHELNEIFISVDGTEMTLEQAIEESNLCAESASYYESEITFGHSGDEVEIRDEVSLQEAINNGEFCDLEWYTGSWGSCVGGTQTREVYCERNGVEVDDSYCTETKPATSQSCLYNNVHTTTECTSAGGTVYSTGSTNICRFSSSSCPSGWTSFGWTATSSNTCSDRVRICTGDDSFCYSDGAAYSSCSTSYHSLSSTSRETCTYYSGGNDCSSGNTCCDYTDNQGYCIPQDASRNTCYSTITEIGCY